MPTRRPMPRKNEFRIRWQEFLVAVGLACASTSAHAEPPILVSSVLPSSRSVQVNTEATVFATVLNAGMSNGIGCSISINSAIPATLTYQTTNPADNAVTGTPNTPVDIAAGGLQTFVLTLVANAPVPPQQLELNYQCENSAPAGVITGVNTLDFSASDAVVADVIALIATPTNDGIVELPSAQGSNVFVVASVNVGTDDTILVNAELSDPNLPATIVQCETNPITAVCINPATPSSEPISTTIANQATPTFGFFVTGEDNVPFDPATNRVFVRFSDAFGLTRGSTSVALRTGLPIPRLDADFATAGILTVDSPAAGGSSSQSPSDTIILADGKILSAGFQTIVEPGLARNDQVVLARIDPNGSIDSSFADQGVAAFSAEDLGLSERIGFFPQRVVELSDGRLMLGFQSGDDIAITRLLANGSLDTTFGTQGSVVIDIDGRDDTFADMAMVTGGALIVVGDVDNPLTPSASDPFILKLMPDGSLDSTFGNNGISIIASPGTDIISNQFNAVAVAEDGKITAAGVVRNSPTFSIGDDVFVARFLPDGSLDSDFSDSGVFIQDNNTNLEVLTDVVVNQQGEIFATGEIENNLGLLKLTSTGVPDSSFGDNGVVIQDISDSQGQALSNSGDAVVTLADGRVVVLGSVGVSGGRALTLSQFTATGNLSLNFGQNGLFNSSLDPSIDLESTLAPIMIDAQGRAIVATELRTDDFNESDLQVLRFFVQ